MPTDPANFLRLTQEISDTVGESVLRWGGASNRWYNLQEATALEGGGTWTTRVTNLPAATSNCHTVPVASAASFWRLTVQQ